MQKKKIDYNYLYITLFNIIVILLTVKFNVFGSEIDWLAQHVSIPEYLRNHFYATHNLFPDFAFQIGSGQNIYNLSYYGLYNPLILLSYFLPFIKMSTYLRVLNIILYITFSNLLYYFTRKRHSKTTSIITTIIIISSAPILFHFHRHYMFVDYLPFLILTLLATDKYIEENKLFPVSLGIFLLITTSYYYSIPSIIVVGIYAIYKYLEYNKSFTIKDFIKKALIFIIPIIISILSTSILLLPTMSSIINGRGTIENTNNILKEVIPIFNIKGTLYSTYTLGLTIISILSIIYSLLSKKNYNKFLSIIILIIINIPIFIYLLNGNLYFRSKVLIPIIPLISILLSNFIDNILNKKINLSNLLIISIIIFTLSIIYNYNNKILILIILLDIIYNLLLITIYNYNKLSTKHIKLLIIIPSLIVLLFVNNNELYVSPKLLNKVEDKETGKVLDKHLSIEKDLVRSNNLDNTVYNMNKIYSKYYNNDSIYSSVTNQEYSKFYKEEFKSGIPYRNNLILAENNDILYSTYMGVKYIYTESTPPIGYNKIDKNLYMNNNVLPVIYTTDSLINIKDYNKLKYPYNIPYLLENTVVQTPSNNIENNIKIDKINLDYNIISKSNIKISNNKHLVINSKDKGNIKLKINNLNKDDILLINIKLLNQEKCLSNKKNDQRITINNVSNVLTCNKTYYENNNKTFHYTLSSNNKIDTLNIDFNKGKYVIESINTYKLNYKDLSNINKNKNKLDVDYTLIDNKISGKVSSSSNSYLVTTIPYDKAFIIKIDDKTVNNEKVNKYFLGSKISAGTHKIEIEYHAPYKKEGEVLSLIGILLSLCLLIKDKKHEK